MQNLIAEIHALRTPALLVAVDQEGGRVQRFREGFIELPEAARLGELYVQHPKQAVDAAWHIGWLMAAELRSVGVDFSFAPVLDVQSEISAVIGRRAFSADPLVVGKLAFAWAAGAREAGMVSVGKHYPGHGSVQADSHHDLPIDPRPFETIWNADLLPFRHMALNNIEALMPAHVVYSACDALPAGYSPFWIKQVLRQKLEFAGAVFSDDLSMAAANVAGDYPQRAAAALEAGCDMVLVCNNPQAASEVMDFMADYTDPVSKIRLSRLHGRKHWRHSEIFEQAYWLRARRYLEILETGQMTDLEWE